MKKQFGYSLPPIQPRSHALRGNALYRVKTLIGITKRFPHKAYELEEGERLQ